MKTNSKFLVNVFVQLALLISLFGTATNSAYATGYLPASGTWSGLSGLVAGPVSAIATSGTDVYVGGAFNNVAGNTNAKNIAKWDGSAWSALGAGLNGNVNAITISGMNVYVGGTFTDAGGDVNADYIAKWDGSAWSAVGPLPIGIAVKAIAVNGSDVYIGGTFNYPVGDPRKGIMRWDGSAWSALGSGMGEFSIVNAIAINGADVYAGGTFADAGGNANADNLAKWNGSTWSALGTGVNGNVASIAVSGGNVYIGGTFTDAGGDLNADNIAKWNGSAWSALGSGLNNGVSSIAASGTDLYVGGNFASAGGHANANNIAKWDGSAWSALGTGTNGVVQAIAINRGDLYAGGTFSDAGGAPNTFFVARYQVTGATITVNTALNIINNDGNCSLSEAIQSANTNSGVDACTPGLGPDTILFSNTLGTATILLPADLPDIADAYGLTINGGGDITISGGGLYHPFNVPTGMSLTLDGMTVINGKSSIDYGGAVTNYYGQLTILNSAFTNNNAPGSGAVDNFGGILFIANSTFSGNTATTYYDGAVGSNSGTATITNSSFSGNSAPNSGAVGNSNGSMEITASTFSGNLASSGVGNGGAILNFSVLTIANSAFSENSAPFTGGGIMNNGTGTLNLTNSTFSGNSANLGGGIFNAGKLNLTNSILANSPSGSDCFNYSTGTVTGSHNIIETDSAGIEACGTTSPLNVDPQLRALANNGGSTLTFGLLPGSPALNAGDNATCAATDQRGIARPQVGVCDIGAYEHVNSVPSGIALSANSVAENLPVGTLVGSLSTTDANPADTHTYSFCGGANDASFSLAGNALKTAAIFDYETKASYSICIRTNDGYGGLFNKTFTINVSNVAENITATFRSTGAQDGWILESTEASGKGGTINSSAATLRLGDDAAKKQYRSILSFATGADLPDNAVITKVTLKVKRQGVTGGGDPVAMFQGFMVDFRKGSFGQPTLQAGDFQAAANKSYGPFSPALASGWYSFNLTTAKAYVNKLATGNGLTQIRLSFKLDDNNNAVANYLSLYSGNAGAASRPQLIIEYYVP